MPTNDYDIVLTSYPDADDFVVEIWQNNNLIAVVNENGEVEKFCDRVAASVFESDEFSSVLNNAKKKLNIE